MLPLVHGSLVPRLSPCTHNNIIAIIRGGASQVQRSCNDDVKGGVGGGGGGGWGAWEAWGRGRVGGIHTHLFQCKTACMCTLDNVIV